MVKKVNAAEVRANVLAVARWLDGEEQWPPPRQLLAAAVRGTVRLLGQDAPGKSVEVRVPPFAAVQCIDGPIHTRGTPANVVETDPRTWLLVATGRREFAAEAAAGTIDASGGRAGEITRWLPIVKT